MMSVMVSELYAALRAAGVEEAQARAAAEAVLSADTRNLATKADLAELKADLQRHQTLAMIALTAIYGGLVAMLKVFA